MGEKTDAPARVRTRSWTMDLYGEENKVTSSVYMRVCASTYGTKEEEEDIKRGTERKQERERGTQRDDGEGAVKRNAGGRRERGRR